MNTLTVRLSTMADTRARFLETGSRALAGKSAEAIPTLNCASYDDMLRVLAPSRLAIVKALAELGACRAVRSRAALSAMCRPCIAM